MLVRRCSTSGIELFQPERVKVTSMITSGFSIRVGANHGVGRSEVIHNVPLSAVSLPSPVCVKKFNRFFAHSDSNSLGSLTQE